MAQCRVIRASTPFEGKQGLDYFSGISAESAGSTGICMHMLVLPPGARSKAHYHEAHETAVHLLEGRADFVHGHNLENRDVIEAGDYVYIPAGVPHVVLNPYDAVARAVLARTDPNEQESVVLREDLDSRV